MSNFPNFIIVGSMKAGTTQLVNLLKQSKDVNISSKEINYFDNVNEPNLKEYRKYFEFEEKRKQVTGEKSAAYSFVPEVPKRIHSILPNVKLIWVLRKPSDRTYSNYWHAVKSGLEQETFEYCVLNDEIRYQKNIFTAYVKRSIYVNQVKRYLNYFNLSQFHFIVAERLKDNPQGEINKVCDFLEIPHFEVTELNNLAKNETYLPRSLVVEKMAKQIFKNNILYRIIHKINKKGNAGYPKMNQALSHKLSDYFLEYNKELEETIGVDLSVWNE